MPAALCAQIHSLQFAPELPRLLHSLGLVLAVHKRAVNTCKLFACVRIVSAAFIKGAMNVCTWML